MGKLDSIHFAGFSTDAWHGLRRSREHLPGFSAQIARAMSMHPEREVFLFDVTDNLQVILQHAALGLPSLNVQHVYIAAAQAVEVVKERSAICWP